MRYVSKVASVGTPVSRTLVIVGALGLALCPPAWGAPPSHDGKVALFGTLHTHSVLSKDTDRTENDLPAVAFEAARARGLDFMGISDHHKAKQPRGGRTERLRISASDYKHKLLRAAATFNANHVGEFVALAGIEWGNISTGNHLNVFGAPRLPPDSIGPKEYDELFVWAGKKAAFVQFNHPASWLRKSRRARDESVGDFGQALYGSADAFVEAVDPAVKLISIITTVKGGHMGGQFAKRTDNTYRAMAWEKHYQKFLNMGMHLAPAANQDTHRRNWGTVTAARTVVWADDFDAAGVVSAIQGHRVYASEDDELVVAYQVASGGRTYWMGDTVPLGYEEADVTMLVRVFQKANTDGVVVDEGPYSVRIVSDADGIGGRRAAVWGDSIVVATGALTEIEVPVVAGEYIYLEVSEENGTDNAVGDGEDEINNETGNPGADGKRDDLNDAAWTAPIWFVLGDETGREASFVWSKNSRLYHDADCWVIERIGDANRRAGHVPRGRTKHDCHPPG